MLERNTIDCLLSTRINRRQLLSGLISGSAGFALNACSEQPSPVQREIAILEARGVANDHSLINLREVPSFSFTGDGGFVHFSAEGSTITSVQFAWVTNNKEPVVVITEVPISKAIFLPSDNPNIAPTVQFNLDARRLIINDGLNTHNFDSENPNDFLTGDRLLRATFTLPKQDLTSLGNR